MDAKIPSASGSSSSERAARSCTSSGRSGRTAKSSIATYGVIKLTLRPGGYDWNFIEAGSGAVLDAGSEACH